MSDLNTEIKIGADASGVEAGVSRAKRSLKDLGDAAQKTGKQGADGMKGIGAGAENSAKKVETATRSTIASLQRQIAAMEAGDKSSRKYQESLAKMRGVDVSKLKPYLDQLDSLKVKTSLAERAQASFNAVMFKVTAVLAATAAFTAYGRSVINGIDAMNDLADATGASIENISALDRVARETGGNFESMSSALVRFNMVLKDADPNKGAGAVIKALNLDIQELKALDPAEAMRQVAVALEGYANSGDKARAIQELFGKSIKEAAPFLKDLAESGRLNATVTKEQADQAERFNKELFKLSANSLDAGRSLTINLVTAMNTIIESFREGEKASDSFFAGYWGGVRGFYEATGIMDKAVKGSRSVSGGILDLTNQSDSETARLGRGAPPRLQLRIPEDKKKGGTGSSAAASAIKAEQSAYENLITSIKTKLALDRAELAGNAALTESQQMRVKLDEDLAGGRLKLSAIHEKEIRTSLDALGVSEALMNARKQELEYATQAAEAYATALESRQSAAASVADEIAAEREAVAAMGLSKTAVVDLAAAKLEETAASKLRFATIADEIDWTGKLGDAYREEAAQLQQLANLKREGAAKQATVEAAEAAADEWKKTASSIEDALTDALMRGFESGKGFGENLGDSISNYFKTIVAKEIAAAITRAIMAALASNQWGQVLSGALGGGGGGGGDWLSMASNAYSAYTSGAAGGAGTAGAVGGNASAIGSYVGGSMSYANAYGSIYANTTGTGINGLLATNGAYGTAGAGGAAGSGAASSVGYLGYAALIAAAVLVAENLYEKGYNRAAVGYGKGESVSFGQKTQFTSDPNMGRSTVYDTSFERFKSNMLEGLGMSEKWVDILSGTTRMATLFGRKLGAYGYEATIAGGDAEVGGFARYKGGVFRPNKTVKAEVDPSDAAAFDAIVENTIEGSKAMARALGLSDDAINQYTGSLKVNFKGAKTAEEQAERMAKSMDDLQFSLLKAASGGKYSREEFDKMIEAAQASMAAVGITTQGIAEILVQGMTGRLSQADVGDRLSEVIVGGIYNAIASNYAGVIAQAFTSQIITPIFTALAAGVPISQAISQAAINNVVATAQNAAAALNAVFSDPGFRQAIAGIEGAISSVAGSVTKVKVPAFGGRAARSGAADQSAQQRYQLETQLLTLLGNTNRLRQRELAGLSAGNRALQVRIWAIEDAKSAVEAAMSTLERSIEAQRNMVQTQLDAALESESMLNDVFETLRDNIRELRGDVDSTRGAGAAEGRAQILQAISGAITLNNDDLSDAIEAVRNSLDNQAFASKFERDRANLAFAGELSSLADVTEDSLSAAERTVTLLEYQLTSLDSALELAQKQVDTLFGVDTSVKSVANAVLALNVSMSGYAAAVAAAQSVATSGGSAPSGGGSSGGGGGGGSSGSTSAQWTAAGYWSKNIDLQREYANLINLDPGQTDPRFTKDAQLSYRDEYLAWHWNTIGKNEKRRFAKGGYYPGGMALVGEEGPEIINFKQPGQVYTARQTADLMRGDGANTELVKEIRELRSEQRAQASAMVGMQQKLNKIVSRWDSTGIPEERVIA